MVVGFKVVGEIDGLLVGLVVVGEEVGMEKVGREVGD
jgi:hypothetical protein